MSNVLVLNGGLVKEMVSLTETIDIVEYAFSEFYKGESTVYPAVRELVEEHNGIFGVKSSYLKKGGIIGLKAGGFWKENIKKGKLNHNSTMLLFDPETGEPVCLLDANYLTGIRTGAAGAVAAKHLALKNSKVITVIGAGVQSRTQLEGILSLFTSIEEVIVFDNYLESAVKLVNEIQNKGIKAKYSGSAQGAVEVADIIITTTPSFSPIVKTSWLKEGAHINAIGSDTKGKRELEMDRKPDKLVCDFWEQSSIMGEFQHGTSKEDIYAEIGEITSGEKPGRESENEITVFDATGIAIQDLSVAAFVYHKAKEMNKGVTVSL